MPWKPHVIKNDRMVLVEGVDDYEFISRFLKHLEIKNVDVVPVEGKDSKLEESLVALSKQRSFRNINKIALVFDADNQRRQALREIKNALAAININSSGNIGWENINGKELGIFLFPNNNDNGKLEDLFLDATQSDPIYSCVNDYIDCLDKKGANPRNLSKARVQTYLASKPKHTPSLTKAAQDGHWPMDSTAISDLKTFLEVFK